MSAYFVTATGTGIGKTFVTAGLLRHLRLGGVPPRAIKPVVSGFDETAIAESDPGVLLAAMDREVTAEEIARIAPWRFAAPLSPDMAAAREGRHIDFDEVTRFCRKEMAAAEHLFIEGIGGAMVPLDERHTVLDLITALRVPAVLVAGTYLGTLSHTLTVLDVLRSRDVAVVLAVINESEEGQPPAEIAKTLCRFCHGVEIALLERNAGAPSFARLAALLR
ncbi:MAG: dethiobiotin synthase [Alphaproteobacteria bacterium]